METQSPFLRLWELGKSERGGLIRSMISAAIGVLSGMLPYYAAAQIIIALLGGRREWPSGREPGVAVLPELVRRRVGRLRAAGLFVCPGAVHVPQGHLHHPEKYPGDDP